MTIKKSYGEWKSPITSGLIATSAIGLNETFRDADELFWTEMRPNEGGRLAIVQRDAAGEVSDVIPAPFSARSRVHEYGGGAFTVHSGTIYFSNMADQRLYRVAPGEQPHAITAESGRRFADGIVCDKGTWMIAVCEEHSKPKTEAINTLVKIDLKSGQVETLVSGFDFFASPRLSPDGRSLVWLTWNHPYMPWDESQLWLAPIDADGRLGKAVQIAGSPGESINEPRWSPSGVLYFVSDRSDWWNLYRYHNGEVTAVLEMAAEFSGPLWGLGMSTYAFLNEREIVAAFVSKGLWKLGRVHLSDSGGKLEPVSLPFSEIRQVRASGDRVSFIAASSKEPWTIVEWNPKDNSLERIRQAFDVEIDKAFFSDARPIEFETSLGTSHGFYYPPCNPEYAVADLKEIPPLIVISHGGPTGACATNLNLSYQFWTSRGFGVLDVNYGGSTGYGTKYRRRLNGQWGIVDVGDCIAGAKFLVAEKLADPKRLIIRGGSAGGFTTLSAITFHQVFKAGASHYGVSDIELLAQDTHKFESRYDSTLIGPYPQRKDLFVERSPIHYADRISCPLILLQGLEDRVVPPNQSEKMYQAVKAKGIPVAYVTFAGEDHGFRKKESIQRALDSELYFYSRVFGFEPADKLDSIPIENL
jgi:dipeptidyl aminopeptidase/acylaminoacyl peptidase